MRLKQERHVGALHWCLLTCDIIVHPIMIIFCILKEKFLTLYAIHNQMDHNNNSYGWEHILLNSI